jgi:hypothetical protein
VNKGELKPVGEGSSGQYGLCRRMAWKGRQSETCIKTETEEQGGAEGSQLCSGQYPEYLLVLEWSRRLSPYRERNEQE